MIFSVIKNVATTGAQQLQQGHSVSALRVRRARRTERAVNTSGGSFGAAPDFEAANSDNDTQPAGDQPAAEPDVARRHALHHRDLHHGTR